jgi:hypothetical protein
VQWSDLQRSQRPFLPLLCSVSGLVADGLLLDESAVHEVEVIVRIVQREVQMDQSSELCLKDLFLWNRPLLISELQNRLESVAAAEDR